MRCPACGVRVLEEAAYCHRCGASLEVHESADDGDRPTIRQRLTGRQASTDRDEDDVEEDLWEGTFSWKGMIGEFGTGLLVTFGACVLMALYAQNRQLLAWLGGGILLLWIGLLALLAYRKISVVYLVTSQRFVHKMGFFFRVTDRIEMIDVDDVRLTEGLVERMLGTGTIYLRSSDRSHPELRLRGIDNVRMVAKLIDDARRKERVRRGLHIESV